VYQLKHNGSTTDSGHYVTDAMDWTMGMWFLFNDETVTYLANGPKESSGCTGTYSLFYGEQSFLGHHGSMKIITSNKTQSADEENDVVMQDDQMHHVRHSM
jgi:hypothetical protein